ncbi:hypothetical protein D3C87_1166530 [compost metagenome]
MAPVAAFLLYALATLLHSFGGPAVLRAADQVAGMLTDVVALRGFADHLVGDAVHLKTLWPNGVDVAVAFWPSLLHFSGIAIPCRYSG